MSDTSCILETEWTTTTSINWYTDATGALGWEITCQVDGYKHTGPSLIIRKTLFGKRFLLLQLQLQLLGPPLAMKEDTLPL